MTRKPAIIYHPYKLSFVTTLWEAVSQRSLNLCTFRMVQYIFYTKLYKGGLKTTFKSYFSTCPSAFNLEVYGHL